MTKHESTKGFTILEIMIALFILAIGILGILSLQSQAVRYNHNAFLMSKATNLAVDMVDRMRANRAEAVDNNAYEIDIGDAAPVARDCEADVCTPAQLAEWDLEQWKADLANQLPGGDGAVVALVDPNAQNGFSVVVSFLDRSYVDDEDIGQLDTDVFGRTVYRYNLRVRL